MVAAGPCWRVLVALTLVMASVGSSSADCCSNQLGKGVGLGGSNLIASFV